MTRRSRPSPILMLAPLAFVLLGYLYHFSQQKTLTSTKQKLEELQDASDSVDHRFGHISADTASARKQEQTLKAELEALTLFRADIESQRAQLRSRIEQATVPADTVDKTLLIFEAHELFVLESSTTDSGASKSTGVLEPIVKLLGNQTKSASASVLAQRGTYRIRLQGSYQNLRSSLEAITEELPHVILLSAELESVELDTPIRQWTITIMV